MGEPAPARSPFRAAAYWALVLFVFSIPWQGSIQVAGVGTISKFLGFIAVAAGMLAVLFQGLHHRFTDVHVVIIAAAGWTVLSTSWSLYSADSRVAAITSVQLVVMVLLVWEFADTPDTMLGVMRAFVIGSTVAAGGVIQQYLVVGDEVARVSGSGVHPNDVAFVLCLAIPLGWYLGIRARYASERLFARAYIVLALYAIVLTASRSALIIVALALLIVPLSYPSLSWRWRVGLVLAIVTAVALVPSFLPERQIDRLSTISTELEDGDLSSRLQIWRIASEIMAEHPVRGTGVGAGRRAIATLYGQAQGAHNTYLSVALDTGAIGLALFLLVLYATFRTSARVRGLERNLIWVLSLCLLVGLLPRHWEDEKALWLVVSIMIGVGMRAIPADRDGRVLTLPRRTSGQPRAMTLGTSGN